MKIFRRILLWGVLPLTVLLVIAGIVLTMMVKAALTPDAIVARIEAKKNCRVLLGSVDAELLGGKIVLRDVVLLPRDAESDAGKPLAERAAPEGSQTSIRIKEMALDAKLTDLLRKKLTVRNLTLDGLDISFLLERDGSPSLDPLFDPPKVIKGEPNQRYEKEKARRDLAKERRKQSPDAENPIDIDTFNVEELPLPASVDTLHVKNGTIYMKIRRDKTRVRLYDVDLKLSELDVDAGDLANHNSARIEMDARLDVQDRDRTTTYADLGLHAEGDIVPFDAVTGYLNPDLVTAVTLKQGSEIFSLPLIEKLADTLDKLRKAGLDVSDLEDTLVVDEDSTVRLGWRDSALRTVDNLDVGLNGHRLVMEAGSWLHTGSNEHEILGDLTFSQKTSDSAFGKANEMLTGLVGSETAQQIADLLFKPVTREGRVYAPFKSDGDFGRPKVRLRVQLTDLTDYLKDEAKDDAINLLRGLIDRQNNGGEQNNGEGNTTGAN